MRASLISLTILVIGLILGCQQTRPTLSPYQILDAVNNKDADVTVSDIWNELGTDSSPFVNPKNNYKADGFGINLDNPSRHLLMLRISDEFGHWRYLIFDKREGNWSFLGNIDLATVRPWATPEHSVYAAKDNRILLRFQFLVSAGTGISLYDNIWYELGSRKPREVLSYPVKGNVVGWGLAFDREFDSKIIRQGKKNGVYSIEIEYIASYTNAYHDEIKDIDKLFSLKKRVVFIRDSRADKFILDTSNSELSQAQIDGLFNDANDQFLEHNFDELKKLSAKGAMYKKWLRKLLKECKPCPKKEALLRGIQ